MNGDLEVNAQACHSILSEMVENRVGCSGGHPLHRAMRALQKRYSGSFPTDLQMLWNDVRRPIHPDAVVQYHSGVRKLKEWFQNQFTIKEVVNESTEEDNPVDGHSAVDWIAKMEEGTGSSEESDTGSSSDSSGSEGDSEGFENPE